MSNLASVGVALWPSRPKIHVTTVNICRHRCSIATGTSDAAIWLWRIPHEWHPSPHRASQPSWRGLSQLEEDEVATNSFVTPLAVLCGPHAAPISSLAFAYDGETHVLVSADRAATVCVWRLDDGICLRARKNVVSISPDALVNVSCKHKALLACAGSGPDIEVIDIMGLRRIVRLFGHGDWCVDLCVRNQDEEPAEAMEDLSEPTIYSIDRGGTLCCWLADRGCRQDVVGWIPSVQVHTTPVPFPTRLTLDVLCSTLLVVGFSSCALYRLGRDHKLADKAEKPKVWALEGHAVHAETVLSEEEGGESAAARRARRHASVAFRKKGVRRWDSAPPEDFGENDLSGDEDSMSVEGTTPTHAMGSVEDDKDGTTGKWRRAWGVLGSGGQRAIVWQPKTGLYVVEDEREGGEGGVQRVAAGTLPGGTAHLEAIASDAEGWVVGATSDHRVHVWSPGPIVQKNLSGAAGLRNRQRAEALKGGGDAGGEGGGEEGGVAGGGPEVLQALASQGWEYQHGGSVEHGFGGAGADKDDKVRRGVASVVCVEGLKGSRSSSATSTQVDKGVFWLVGHADGSVTVHSLPTAKLLSELKAHNASVKALLWVPGTGCVLSGSDDGEVVLWEWAAARVLCRFQQHTGHVRKLMLMGPELDSYLRKAHVFCSLSSDRTLMIAGCETDDSGRITSGRVLYQLSGHSAEVIRVQWQARTNYLFASCRDGSVHVWLIRRQHPALCLRRAPAPEVPLLLQGLDRPSQGCIIHTDAQEPGQKEKEELDAHLSAAPTLSRSTSSTIPAAEEPTGEHLDFVQAATPLSLSVGSAAGTRKQFLSVLLLRTDVIAMNAAGEGAAAAGVNPSTPLVPRGASGDLDAPDSAATPEAPASTAAASPGLAGAADTTDSPRTRPHSAVPSKILRDKSFGLMQEPASPRAALAGSPGLAPSPSVEGSPVGEGEKKKVWELLDGDRSLLAVSLAMLLSLFTRRQASKHMRGSASSIANRLLHALRSLGIPSFLDSANRSFSYQASCVFVGNAGGLTCLVPRLSHDGGSCTVSSLATEVVCTSSSILLDALRLCCQNVGTGVEVTSALLHFVARELAGRLQAYVDADVISLARYWLIAADSSRQAAHTLLTSRLSRTDSQTRIDIVTHWTSRLNAIPSQSRATSQAADISDKESVASSKGVGFSSEEGPAIIVLAVIGSHFQEALDTRTAARVADGLIFALSSSNPVHAKVASHLLSRGAAVWSRHVQDGEGLMRILYARYWRYQDFSTTLAEAELALKTIAPVLPTQFVEVVGEEAGKHSQLVCHVRSERTVTSIRVLVGIIKRHPIPMLPALPRAVEVVLSTLDPANPLVRQSLMQHSTAALKEIVRRFPQATFHQETQRFAVGTVDALIVIFDVRTATKWRVLEGHEGAISAVTFDAAGQRLATFSCSEGRIRYWETGHSGPFGLFSNKVGRCVQQFTVPQNLTRVNEVEDEKALQIAFGVLFTPGAIVLTRDGHPVCEFKIRK